jgi:hypothetical protein
MSFGSGSSVEIDDSNWEFFVEIARELENDEVFRLLREHLVDYGTEELNAANVFQKLASSRHFGLDCHDALRFLSLHFGELPSEKLAELTYEDLYEILSSSALRMASEDSLYEFISDLIARNTSFFGLLELVHFEFLSLRSIDHFIETTVGCIGLLNKSIWERVCVRLRHRPECSDTPRPAAQKPNSTEFPYGETTPLRGIIAHLSERCGGNVHDTGIVEISAGGVYGSEYGANQTANLTDNGVFLSANSPNQWICYDFKELRVIPTHYTIRSRYDDSVNNDNLKSWFVEGSIDGQDWVELDRKENNRLINGQNLVHTFHVHTLMECRFIRLRHPGQSWRTNWYRIAISSLEIFRTLIEDQQ